MPRLTRTMALDIGDARIGVALSDPLGITAQPHSTVERKQRKVASVLSEIEEIVSKQEVCKIVVGFPIEMDGTVGEQAKKVESFSNKLRAHLDSKGVEIVFWDERLTTVQAQRVVQGSGLKDRERSAALDRIAAAIILESYLQSVQ